MKEHIHKWIYRIFNPLGVLVFVSIVIITHISIEVFEFEVLQCPPETLRFSDLALNITWVERPPTLNEFPENHDDTVDELLTICRRIALADIIMCKLYENYIPFLDPVFMGFIIDIIEISQHVELDDYQRFCVKFVLAMYVLASCSYLLCYYLS